MFDALILHATFDLYNTCSITFTHSNSSINVLNCMLPVVYIIVRLLVHVPVTVVYQRPACYSYRLHVLLCTGYQMTLLLLQLVHDIYNSLLLCYHWSVYLVHDITIHFFMVLLLLACTWGVKWSAWFAIDAHEIHTQYTCTFTIHFYGISTTSLHMRC